MDERTSGIKARWELILLPPLALTAALLVASQFIFVKGSFHRDLGYGDLSTAYELVNYLRAFSDPHYLNVLLLSINISAAATVLTMACAAPAHAHTHVQHNAHTHACTHTHTHTHMHTHTHTHTHTHACTHTHSALVPPHLIFPLASPPTRTFTQTPSGAAV